ncbi:MAG TPA: carbamate kinase [Candidatus Magasanikbacteria bacterium]|jgi:carbamate kinase|nr:carbamate kinase [Candidatus Magasanikbacteria bacterium]HQF57243.1 carbamate kinase [Candidatus Magasanikbacteria bacterium]
MGKRIVLAVGGNALITDKNHQSEADQYEQVKITCGHIAPLIEAGHELVISHGNGPQVGFILESSELAFQNKILDRIPIDSADAQTQGSIGFYLVQNLRNILTEKNLSYEVAGIITQSLVDINDPAFNNPTKPIGSFYTQEEAQALHEKNNWTVAEDAGRGWRRVIPSPEPINIIEKEIIKKLLKEKIIIIASGGGGIPVIKKDNKLIGIEAVIDKDKASALLANEISADELIIATAVEKVYLNYKKSNQQELNKVNLKEIKKYLEAGHFAKGSMLPKIQAVIKFLENGGKKAIITSPEKLSEALAGKTGTHITN